MMLTRQSFMRSVLGTREPVLDEILRRSLLTARMPTIQVDDNAGRILQLLTLLHRPQHVIEIGTLFGYSTIHIARGLPPGGRLTTLEVDAGAAKLAQENFAIADVADRVTLVVGDAVEYLATVTPESVGMVFIDADKKSYPEYLKRCFPLLAPGGLLIADDAFGDGDFTGESEGADDREVTGIHAYCRAAGRSPRLLSAFIGTEHGLLVSVKR